MIHGSVRAFDLVLCVAACDAPAAAAGGGGGGGMPVFTDGVQRIFECLVPLPFHYAHRAISSWWWWGMGMP